LTEKVDVYGLGNFFYFLYTRGRIPYRDIKSDEAAALMIMKGVTPIIHDYISQQFQEQRANVTQDSFRTFFNNTRQIIADGGLDNDPFMKTLFYAMIMCHAYDSQQRPSASEVISFLVEKSRHCKPNSHLIAFKNY